MGATEPDRGGVAAAVGSYALWGLSPAFWPLLAPAAPVEVLAHRILWTSVIMALVLAAVRGWGALRGLPARTWSMVAAAAALITVNWGVYLTAVLIGQVVAASLGYFMSPLVSVLLGVLVLRERLRRPQWVAVGLGATAVVVIAVESGQPPWLALVLATSFGLYGLIKRTVPLAATPALAAEGLVVGPIALAVVVGYQVSGAGTLTAHGPAHAALLLAAGPATTVPLLLYGVAARRVSLSTIGVLMYLNPVLQFTWGVLVDREAMPPGRWIGFGLVWVALVVFTVDLVRAGRAARARRRASTDPAALGQAVRSVT